MTIKGLGKPFEERLKTTKVSLTKTQLRVEVIELSILRLDGEQRERAEALLGKPKALCMEIQEGIEDIERLLQNANSEQRETLEATLIMQEGSLVSLQQIMKDVGDIIELSEYAERDQRRDRRARRLNAGAVLARFEYKFYLLLTMSIVAVFFLFFARSAFGWPAVERQNFGGHIIASLIIGWGTAKTLRVSYFSRKLLKKYNEKQLREMWLSYGGFWDE